MGYGSFINDLLRQLTNRPFQGEVLQGCLCEKILHLEEYLVRV